MDIITAPSTVSTPFEQATAVLDFSLKLFWGMKLLESRERNSKFQAKRQPERIVLYDDFSYFERFT